jgi:serine phosphatase RsbU (regulator of sigma subunit)/tetratricopeptide (TPR) repeat protein
MKKTAILILPLVLSFFCGYSQSRQEIDSLLNLYKSTKNDSLKIILLLEIGNRTIYTDPDTTEIIQLSGIGICDKALKTKSFNQDTIFKHKAVFYGNLGTISANKGDFDKALDFYYTSLNLKKKINDLKGIAMAYNNLGNVTEYQGNLKEALDYYYDGIAIAEQVNENKVLGLLYNNIGFIYYTLAELDKAKEFFAKSLEYQIKAHDYTGIADAYGNMAQIEQKKGNHNESVRLNRLAKNYSEKLNDQAGIAQARLNIAVSYTQLGLSDSAMIYIDFAIVAFQSMGYKYPLAFAYLNKSKIFANQAKDKEAFTYVQKALSIAEEVNYPEQLIRVYEHYSNLLTKQGKYKEALHFYTEMVRLEKQQQDSENKKQTIRKSLEYEYLLAHTADSIKMEEQKRVIAAELKAKDAQLEKEALGRYALFGGLAIVVVFALFLFKRFKIEQQQKEQIAQKKAEVEHQKHLVEEKNQEIMDSITYAKRIQEAILPSRYSLTESLKNGFVLFKPKDIVSGDFYWLEKVGGSTFFAAADCTGHGVPGAMVSVVCSNALSKALLEENITEPGKLLDRARELVVERFAKSNEDVKDGMDISLVALQQVNSARAESESDYNLRSHAQTHTVLHWAGANNPLWIIKKNPEGVTELVEVKPNKQPIGKVDNPESFTTHTIELHEDDTIYIFTDGYQDQFGGEKGKKFKAAQLKDLLLSIQDKTMDEQKEFLDKAFENWRGNLEQIDDVCIIGVRV